MNVSGNKNGLLIIHGPNLNLLGTREPEVYGHTTLADINARLAHLARRHGAAFDHFQSNHEGALVSAPDGEGPEVQLLASGVGMPWVEEARRILAEEWGVRATTWSVTSWNELRRQALEVEKANFLAPDAERQVPYLTQKLSNTSGPFIATSDYDHLL